MRISGIVLIGFLALTSILLISIILGLKISSRKVEIKILKLVGATNWYVIGPFLLEGTIYAVSGAVIGWGLTYLLLLYSTPFLVTFLGDIPLLPVSFLSMLLYLLGLVGIGIIIGNLSSFLATRRFLQR
jgi:cell division transport system permease protein